MRRLIPRILASACLILSWVAAAPAQADRFTGRWVASEPDHGVLVSLTLGGESNSFTMPGVREDARTETLTLPVMELTTRGNVATFRVELPENENTLDLEFTLNASGDAGSIRVVRVDGDAADDDVPTWVVKKQP